MNLKDKLKGLPTIYYVNLDHRTDRRDYMESQFDYWRISNFHRISATKYLSTEDYKWQHLVLDKEISLGSAAIGDSITHIEMIKNWLETTNEEHLLIMEDDYDLSLIEYWNFDWNYLMNHIPENWDCIQLGFESTEFIPFFLHPKLRHSYFGPVLLRRDYVEKILSLHCYKDKYRFDCKTAILDFSSSSTTVDYFVGHTGKTYCIPLITTNTKLTSTEHSLEINRLHHDNSRHAYYWWWMTKHLNYSLDDFFTYGKPNDREMIILTTSKLSTPELSHDKF